METFHFYHFEVKPCSHPFSVDKQMFQLFADDKLVASFNNEQLAKVVASLLNDYSQIFPTLFKIKL